MFVVFGGEAISVINRPEGISVFALPVTVIKSETEAYPRQENKHIKESTIPVSVFNHVFII